MSVGIQSGLAKNLMIAAGMAVLLPICAPTARAAGPDNSGGAPVFLDDATQPAAPAASPFAGDLTGDWGGERQRLQDAGITPGATLLLEGFSNFQGGIDTAHLVGATTFDLNVTLDTQKLLHWDGGEFYVDLEDHAFRDPSTALVGDLQVFDKANAAPYFQVYEAWYQQTLFDGKLRIKIGKVDANSVDVNNNDNFAIVDNAQTFLNSSSQVSPTIFVMPTTPDPMPSINLFLTPTDWYFASFGAFYGNRSDRFGNIVDPQSYVQRSDFGTFLIGETGLKWHTTSLLAYAGNLKIGEWGHTGTFTRFDGIQQEGTYGFYSILDQTLWQPSGEPENGRGLRSFLEFAQTQDDINAIDRHIGGGLTWTGPIDSRPGDIIGFTPEYAHIAPDAGLPHPYELEIEGFYQWQLTPWAFVQPDLQYIVHPGGRYDNALVATVRVQITF
ncbi:MAG: carbohydrate porin [Tepidisphaeraceae bacterium]|jgi:porin